MLMNAQYDYISVYAMMILSDDGIALIVSLLKDKVANQRLIHFRTIR